MRVDVRAFRCRLGLFAELTWRTYLGKTTHGPPEWDIDSEWTGFHKTKAGLIRDIRERMPIIKAWERKNRAEWRRLE